MLFSLVVRVDTFSFPTLVVRTLQKKFFLRLVKKDIPQEELLSNMAELAFLLMVAYHWLCYMKGEAMELCRCMLCYGPSICTQAQAHQKERSDKACGEKEHPSCTFSSLGLLLDAEVQEHMQKHRVEVKAYVTIYTSGRCI